MFSDEAAKEETAPEVLDIAEIVAKSLQKPATS
jgi:hypothetical protein